MQRSEDPEFGAWGEGLEEAVVEIKNLLPRLEDALGQIAKTAVAIRSKDLGFDRHSAFWPTSFPDEATYGIAWSDDPELVAGIEPPPDSSPGWKLDPHHGDRVRFWTGEEWDLVVAPAPGNLDLYRRIASGQDVGVSPRTPTIHGHKATESALDSDDCEE